MTEPIQKRAIAVLRETLETRSRWVKVHAAEFLLWTHHSDGVREAFLAEERLYGGDSSYRIGIWRVLAQAAPVKAEKDRWVDKVLQAFLDPDGQDRIHAAETLAKLKVSPVKARPDKNFDELITREDNLALCTRWSILSSSPIAFEVHHGYFLDLLASRAEDTSRRRLAAYVIRNAGNLSVSQWTSLSEWALTEPEESQIKIPLLCAAAVTVPEDLISSALDAELRSHILLYKLVPRPADRLDVISFLAERGTQQDLPALISLMENDHPLGSADVDADVGASAAFAIIRIIDRIEQGTTSRLAAIGFEKNQKR